MPPLRYDHVMASVQGATTRASKRVGQRLRIGREEVVFGRNILRRAASGYSLQPRLFVNDPWALIAEAIARCPEGRPRDIAQSFRRQAEDYFRAATVGREVAVRPVLLYYAFLNLSKAYAFVKGSTRLSDSAHHGISQSARPRAIVSTLITFKNSTIEQPSVFHELLLHLGGDPLVLTEGLPLGYLLPQILPGHRLWCYATNKPERFIPIEGFEVLHSQSEKQVWLNLFLRREDLSRLSLTDPRLLAETNLHGQFEVVSGTLPSHSLCLQQACPSAYSAEPAEALHFILSDFKNRVWETVKVSSPYRKPYLYLCPTQQRRAILPQMLSIYVLMFFLGSVTRYSPGYFADLLDSRYGPLIETFITESPMQFLYLMASDILQREVSKPAII